VRSLPLPARNEHQDYETCIKRRSASASQILRGQQNTVFYAYSRYEDAAFLDGCPGKPDHIADVALRDNFKLLEPGRPLADLREKIMNMGVNDRCPFCGRAPASSLDHYLPKSTFSCYSVLARNLVPICDRCNRNKSNTRGLSQTLRFFHPYYDEIPSHRILRAAVTVDPIVDLSYYIDDACGAPSSIIDTFKFTYIQLQLQRFYVQEAYDDMGDLSLLRGIYVSGLVMRSLGFRGCMRDEGRQKIL
jgi:hypothetical protein